MTRRTTYILIILILINILSGCSTSSSKEIDFNEQTFYRTASYDRTFKMLYADTDGFGIGFEENICSVEDAKQIALEIGEDVKEIAKFINGKTTCNKFYIYLVDEALVDNVYSSDDQIYCRLSDLNTDNFTIALIQSFLSITEPWISNGLHSLIYNNPINSSNLIDYYSSNDDISILGLFGARFYNEFNSENELDVAKDTAASLADFVLTNYGYDTLLKHVTDEIKQSWLNYMGVSKKYNYDYSDLLKDFKFSESKEYPIIVATNDATYYISTYNDQLTTSKAIEKFIYEDIVARRYILDFLLTNTRQNQNMVNGNKSISYYINDFPNSNSSERGEIELNNISAFLHEAAHVMIRPDKVWVFEGLADYLSIVIYQPYCLKDAVYSLFNAINQKHNDGTISDNDSQYLVLEYYVKAGGDYSSINNIDLKIYCDASACINLSTTYGGPSERNSISEIHNISVHNRIEGDELSYKQACSFISYILCNNSLDTLLVYSKSGSDFEDVFGKSYEEMKSDWITSISIDDFTN